MKERSSSSTSSSSPGGSPRGAGPRAAPAGAAALGFAALVAGWLVVVGGVWLAVNLARRDVRIDNGPPRVSCDFLAFKRELVDATPGRRVLLFGLSNVLMGMRADEIGSALGARALNYGLVANLSTGMAFEAADRVVRRGDVVVLSLPHWFYQRETTLLHQEPVVRDLVFSCPTRGWFWLPLRYQLEFLAKQDVQQVFEALARKGARAAGAAEPWPPPEVAWHLRVQSDGGAFTPTGDYVGNRREDRRDVHVERVRDHPLRLAELRVDRGDESVRSLARFVALARERGVGLVAVWPPAFVADDGLGSIVDETRALYRDLGVPLVGDAREFLYELDDFFDTPNHLTREAASRYSERVAELVAPFVAARARAGEPANTDASAGERAG